MPWVGWVEVNMVVLANFKLGLFKGWDCLDWADPGKNGLIS